ncbi:hypothetical protein BU23DRAFT_558933 [Bimuria novae-zelandiae CBS 107.79]|uniref:Peroxin 11C n=1 Tax=Bimuria novae-zelandiae CBS 107.79 TaxID=1447943 RepID=A0A6A5UTC6_9PLEO|nr:hypothetical protein BU23DRAFT_558933 [Bimuria novae-zelandiae CBS 107.79]
MASEEHPASTTIPSEPKPSPRPASEAKKQPPADRSHEASYQQSSFLHKYLAYQARRLDRLLVRLSTLLASPTSTDALLGTLCYTLELLAALLSRFLNHRLTSLASTIAEKADRVLLPGETLVTTIPTTASDKILAQVLASSKALAAVIADYRIFVRLWGLAGLYMWARSTWNTPVAKEEGTKAKVVRRITWAQIASLILFQVLENGVYLASKGVLTSSGWSGEAGKSREIRWWVWSSRFWAVHVALELVRVTALKYYGNQEDKTEQEKALVADGEKEGKLLVDEKKKERWTWWRDAVSNIAYMPMTLHWSVDEDNGFLSDWGVGVLGAIAGGSLLVDVWKQTA